MTQPRIGDRPSNAPNIRVRLLEEALPEPFFEDDEFGITLYRGNALRLLGLLPASTIDCVFADPPYFLSNGGMTCQNGKVASVDKGKWDKASNFDEVHAFNETWLDACRRLLKPDGCLWCTGTRHNIFSVGYALQEAGWNLYQDICWYKPSPPPNLACNRWQDGHEWVLWAWPGSRRGQFDYEGMKRENGGTQMRAEWTVDVPRKGTFEKRFVGHPTQKPEALLDRILRATTVERDTVMDPFCGSGTTGVACARLGRRFIGIDEDENALSMAVGRICDETGQVRTVLVISDPKSGNRKRFDPPDVTVDGTWRSVVVGALRSLGGEAPLSDIIRTVGQHEKARTQHWQAKVRQTVRIYPKDIVPVSRGVYALAN